MLGWTLASAIALALSGVATAQTTPAGAPAAAAQGRAGQFYPGTASSATYPIQGGTLTVHAGMPAETTHYGPPPAFQVLDTNHDGRISEAEAEAYPPLDSDFLNASRGGTTVNRAQYATWIEQLH
jgi:hypothetical protein